MRILDQSLLHRANCWRPLTITHILTLDPDCRIGATIAGDEVVKAHLPRGARAVGSDELIHESLHVFNQPLDGKLVSIVDLVVDAFRRCSSDDL